jgi:uncharacterized protein YbjT (DUF2867 family)
MENLTTWGTQDSDEGLAVMTPLASTTTLQMIAVDDIAAIIGVVFAEPERYIGEAFDIAGDELTMPDTANVLGAAIGQPVRYAEVPWDTVRAQNEDIYLMYEWLERKSYSADIADVRKMYPELLDFRAWVARGGARPLALRRTT